MGKDILSLFSADGAFLYITQLAARPVAEHCIGLYCNQLGKGPEPHCQLSPVLTPEPSSRGHVDWGSPAVRPNEPLLSGSGDHQSLWSACQHFPTALFLPHTQS